MVQVAAAVEIGRQSAANAALLKGLLRDRTRALQRRKIVYSGSCACAWVLNNVMVSKPMVPTRSVVLLKLRWVSYYQGPLGGFVFVLCPFG